MPLPVRVVTGNPDPDRISTSYVERQNLNIRMGMRRFTRLTNAFSKKIENHTAAVTLQFMCHNYARPHRSLASPHAGHGCGHRGPYLDVRGDSGAAGLAGKRTPRPGV
jgi:hypothetical protein